LAAGKEITQRRKNSFPETSPEEDVSFFGCRQGDHPAEKKFFPGNVSRRGRFVFWLQARRSPSGEKILSRKRLPKRTFRFLAAGKEITQRRKNSFPETSPEEDL